MYINDVILLDCCDPFNICIEPTLTTFARLLKAFTLSGECIMYAFNNVYYATPLFAIPYDIKL